MAPRNTEEMVNLLTGTATAMIYLEITRAAKKHRLDEADIEGIERDVLIEISKSRAFVSEFPFNVEAAILHTEKTFKELFAAVREARMERNVRDKRGKT